MTSDRITIFIISSISILFFFIYSMLNFTAPQKYTSPDETVNLYFAELYAKTGSLRYYEPLSDITFGYLRPRNSTTVNSYVSPNSFAGFYMIYGLIGTISLKIIPFITPAIAVLGGLFVYTLTSVLFNKKTALISLIFLYVNPLYWLWSSMTMFNNIPATVFLIGGLTFFMLSIHKKHVGFYIGMGLCFGLNHFFRFTDVTYGIPLIFLGIYYRKSINYKYVGIALLTYLLIVSQVFIINKSLYGNVLSFGYKPSLGSEVVDPVSKLYNQISFFILPSGFKPSFILNNFITYVLSINPVIIVLAVMAFFHLKYFSHKVKAYSIYVLLLCVWILIYYGSGTFWGLNNFTLDASYTRYFLPIYILLIPIAIHMLLSFQKHITILVTFVLIIISVLNVNLLRSGLVDMQVRRISAWEGMNTISKATEPNAVIITTLGDKYIFPERKVLTYGPVVSDFITNESIFNYDTLVKIIRNLSEKQIPTYIYNDRLDLNILTVEQSLSPIGLGLKTDNEVNHLYKIVEL